MAVPKLRSLNALSKRLHALRRHGDRVVFTNGCFDVLHVGHLRLLQKAKRLGDFLIVGLNSDTSVRRLKGPKRPIHKACDRAELLSGLEAVDCIVIFSEKTPEKLIRRIRPHVLVKGGDWKRHEIVGGSFVRSYGGRVYIFPTLKGYSTTRILEYREKKSSGK